ncbi:hypothetical protein C1645_882855 [Glomus cerebriforme]|uniref:Uncharacterized protein n=1 Tax=Glomus cerebriforme TaxID=658196 RepID=A0A397S8I6_9GLOM|nr:hypothetical protein C1645_882855 [Glomus cerebriforme]
MPNESETNNNLEMNKTNYSGTSHTSRLLTSKVYQFGNFPEPRNATEEEQEAFHSKSYDFHIPDNVHDFVNSSNQKNNNSTLKKISSIFKVNSKKLSKKFKNLRIKNDTQNDYNNVGTMHHTYIDNDKDDAHNNSNLHSEEQNDLEIPEVCNLNSS